MRVWLQMLAFTQHSYMLLAAKAMPFWTNLLTSSERSAARIEPLAPENSPIPMECVAVLMDLAGDFPLFFLLASFLFCTSAFRRC